MSSQISQKSTQVVGLKVAKTLELFEHENVKEYFTSLYKDKVIHAISVDYPETGDNFKTKIADRHTYTHGFVSAIHEAYNLHQHLRLKPDDVWLTIAQGVSQHINLNAEKFRSYFVEHEEKKLIKVYAGDVLYLNEKDHLEGDWPEIVHRLENATSENIEKMDLPKTLECDFSTSTSAAKTASRVILLDALKQYFDYKIFFRCGIPKVTLEGSLEDWVHLQEKVVNLRNFGLDLDFWLDRLEPVIWKLVATYRGEIAEEFWSKVFLKMGGGSGMPPYWTGWITAFFPYDKQSKKITTNSMATTSVPDGRVNVPFDTDIGLYLSFSAGFLGARQELVGSGDDAEVYVSPLIGWFVVDRDKNEKNNSN
ncbi:1605_t:CDS:1 [Ambispora leptoticha]|uniref:1605_t:CDS:1 n=1 Tax=Ambispora leptoticha TaxID=144679 RepID=A0A9N9FS42_9GLOM|nr:1605_t:CDS:1 [Ambispora leptoticha]